MARLRQRAVLLLRLRQLVGNMLASKFPCAMLASGQNGPPSLPPHFFVSGYDTLCLVLPLADRRSALLTCAEAKKVFYLTHMCLSTHCDNQWAVCLHTGCIQCLLSHGQQSARTWDRTWQGGSRMC